MGGEGEAEVAALEDEGDGGQDRLDLVGAGLVVAEEVGLGDGVGDAEGFARDEAGGGGHGDGASWDGKGGKREYLEVKRMNGDGCSFSNHMVYGGLRLSWR